MNEQQKGNPKLAENYTPLYRKYRPQKFNDLIGQETVVKTLSNAIELDKVAHAYLFTGSRGTGKTSTARILAKSLNCIEGPTVNPCGKCPSCVDIANSNSIDVIEIDAASNRNVEDARNLIDKVHFMPVAGKYKVYIIDEVHMLTPAAFNTLLKTLEEPPKNLVFILATTESHKVLTTIISRCQRFDFKRVNQDLISKRLKEIAKKENITINDKAVSVISRRCHGGMRDALGLLDQASVISSVKEELQESDIISLMGSMPEDTLFKIADCFANRNTSELITLIDNISVVNEPVQVIRELINYFRNVLFVKTSNNLEEINDLIDVSENILPDIKQQTHKFETNEIVQIIEKLSECERTLKTSSQQLLWMEVGLIGICHRHDIQVIKELESRILQLEEAIYSGHKPTFKPASIQNQTKPIEIPVPANISKPEPEKQTAVINEQTSDYPEDKTVTVKSIQGLSNEESIQKSKNEQSLNQVNLYNKEDVNISENISESWKTLQNNLDSTPAKSFFECHNIRIKPIEINSEKIIIVFENETIMKQAKETGKITSLEKAAEKLFGTLPKIIVRTPLPEDSLAQKKNKELETSIPTTTSTTKPQQISTPLVDEVLQTQKKNIIVDENPVSDTEKEIAEELEETKIEIKPIYQLSDLHNKTI